MTTTTKSLTAQQIDNLRRESAQSGDFAMTAICSLALTGKFDPDDWTTLERRDARRISGMSTVQAVAEIVEAINAAEAMA